MNSSRILNFGSDFCDRCATDAEHFGEKFLSEGQCITFRPISRLEQPTAKASLYDVHGVARSGDPCLRQKNFIVLNTHHADRVTVGGGLPELSCGDYANSHWKLHDHPH